MGDGQEVFQLIFKSMNLCTNLKTKTQVQVQV